jgi:4-hydroxybenzoate polyprenyltransferase
MLAFQSSIGALNDLIDAPLDAGRKPGKPLPRGVTSSGAARRLLILALVLGLVLAAPSGPATVIVGVGGVACGYAYDVWLSRTPWSWLPLALALPLLPIFAWLGAASVLPLGLLGLIPIGVVAGAMLGLANGIADIERDVAAGVRTAAVRLGRRAAWQIHAVLAGVLILIVAILLPRPAVDGAAWAGIVLAKVAGFALIALGAGLAAHEAAAVRERGWESEALGVALVGLAWVAAAAVG